MKGDNMENTDIKHLVFCEKNSFQQVKSLLISEKHVTLVCLDEEIREELERKKIPYKVISDYKFDFDIANKCIDWFKTWANSKIFEGKNVKELFTYRQVSLWWFMEIAIFESFKGVKFPIPIKKIIEEIEFVKKVIETEKPERVTVLNTNDPFHIIISEISNSMGLNSRVVRTRAVILRELGWSKGFPLFIKLFSKTRHFIRRTLSSVLKLIFREQNCKSTKKVMIISININWRNKKDFIFGTLIEELSKSGKKSVTHIDFPGFSLIGIRQIFEKKMSDHENITYKIIEDYSANTSIKEAVTEIKKKYSQIKKEKIFYEAFDISSFFYKQMDFHFHYYGLSNYIYYIESMLKAIGDEKPEAIILIDEYNPVGRATVVAGKISGIKTIAIQHGAITRNRLSYLHYKDEVSKNNDFRSPYYPLPDITAVFGPYYQKYLYEIGNYPESSISVTGAPRYDELVDGKNEYNKKQTYKKLNLDPDKKLVVYTSQPLEKEENDRILLSILKALSELPDFQLVIKMHPTERGINTELIDKFDEDVIVIKKFDIYEILNACDVMLTAFSTTALEAMMLGKPVITINFTGKPDVMPYVQSGAAIGVYQREKLSLAIKSIFEDEHIRKELEVNSKEFVHQHAYKIDGKSTKRIMELIP